MSDDYHFPAQRIRDAILDSIPSESSQFGDEPPEARFIYPPWSHAPALDPSTIIVGGIRGAGKSLWWAALLSPAHRRMLRHVLPKAGISESTTVTAGFGSGVSVEDAPTKDVLRSLLQAGFEPRQIWKAVVGWQVAKDRLFASGSSWKDRVKSVQDNPEDYEMALTAADRALLNADKLHLILFDALDTAADDWPSLRGLLKGLLQVALEMRSRRAIRIKMFVRPDMLEDSAVTNFPDASKVLASRVNLIWSRVDLYGLLWQHLGNAPVGGYDFREGCEQHFSQQWENADSIWKIPHEMRIDPDLQRRIFHAIAGPWMGRERRRGFPYTWLPNRLVDGYEQASPRSFQASLRMAASTPAPTGWEFALHFDGIKRGVQEASEIRVREVEEDYPWVKVVMEPLRGNLVIPCGVEDLERLWIEGHILRRLSSDTAGHRLPPRRLALGFPGLVDDLRDIGILQRLGHDRLQMPDVYRVAFGLGRRGGVPPLK